MGTVSVRYIVDDVAAAIDFYAELGFGVDMNPGPQFAMLSRGDLQLALNIPGAGGGGQPAADGRVPEPGGWNRIRLQFDDLDRAIGRLRATGAVFRTDVIAGMGARQIVVDDPAGNPVELFEPPK